MRREAEWALTNKRKARTAPLPTDSTALTPLTQPIAALLLRLAWTTEALPLFLHSESSVARTANWELLAAAIAKKGLQVTADAQFRLVHQGGAVGQKPEEKRHACLPSLRTHTLSRTCSQTLSAPADVSVVADLLREIYSRIATPEEVREAGPQAPAPRPGLLQLPPTPPPPLPS